MAYVAPTTETFKARFPEFEPVADALVTLVIEEAVLQVDGTWLERDRAKAQMYLVAHLLASEGEPARSVGAGSGAGYDPSQGQVKKDKVGDVETEWFGPQSSTGGGEGQASSYGSSHYGREFERIQRANFGGAHVMTP